MRTGKSSSVGRSSGIFPADVVRVFAGGFKLRIHAVDSIVIQLVANCMDWAKHRRRKAAAKMHLRLDLPQLPAVLRHLGHRLPP